jgi:glutamate N-acetyltransferase / amino-acid N-acetyltransferase
MPEPFQPHDPPRLPSGFLAAGRHAGLKPEGEEDLAVFLSSEPAAAAALFTRNHFPGAPIVLGRERIRSGRFQAVVVNSRVANVAMGAQGLADAREMARIAAEELGVPEELVLVGSTGVIGRRLPMQRIRRGLAGIREDLSTDPWPAARAIMTTDTHPKVRSVQVGDAVLTAVGKGAGMVAPNLATMLVYLFTDAALAPIELDAALRRAAEDSFQLLSVDTDTSTSDMVAILANGRAGPVEPEPFSEALRALCTSLAETLARDGEGATKLIRVRVEGAADRFEARRIARAVADSPLVKTMAYGADPNVGRILMAVGKCVECRVVPDRVSAWAQGVEVIRGGEAVRFDLDEVRSRLAGDPVELRVALGVGPGEATALGCDLTEGYIRENAAYASS